MRLSGGERAGKAWALFLMACNLRTVIKTVWEVLQYSLRKNTGKTAKGAFNYCKFNVSRAWYKIQVRLVEREEWLGGDTEQISKERKPESELESSFMPCSPFVDKVLHFSYCLSSKMPYSEPFLKRTKGQRCVIHIRPRFSGWLLLMGCDTGQLVNRTGKQSTVNHPRPAWCSVWPNQHWVCGRETEAVSGRDGHRHTNRQTGWPCSNETSMFTVKGH